MIHMVEKLHHIIVANVGECFGIVEFIVYLLKYSFFAVIGFFEVQIIIFK